MKIVNLTKHSINFTNGKEIPPSGQEARVSVTYTEADEVGGYPFLEAVYGDVVGLPDEEVGVGYVVSRVVVAALQRAGIVRMDLFVPGSLVRDESGRVVGCRGLVR